MDSEGRQRRESDHRQGRTAGRASWEEGALLLRVRRRRDWDVRRAGERGGGRPGQGPVPPLPPPCSRPAGFSPAAPRPGPRPAVPPAGLRGASELRGPTQRRRLKARAERRPAGTFPARLPGAPAPRAGAWGRGWGQNDRAAPGRRGSSVRARPAGPRGGAQGGRAGPEAGARDAARPREPAASRSELRAPAPGPPSYRTVFPGLLCLGKRPRFRSGRGIFPYL